MSTNAFWAILIVCFAVIGLSVYFIARQLKQNKERADRIAAGEDRLREERTKRIESIQILMRAVEEDEKLTWTEASIRVKNLLDQLSVDLSDHEDVKAVYLVEEHTQHIPTHDQWNALPLAARRKYQAEMDALEAAHVERLRRAKTYLLAYNFSE